MRGIEIRPQSPETNARTIFRWPVRLLALFLSSAASRTVVSALGNADLFSVRILCRCSNKSAGFFARMAGPWADVTPLWGSREAHYDARLWPLNRLRRGSPHEPDFIANCPNMCAGLKRPLSKKSSTANLS